MSGPFATGGQHRLAASASRADRHLRYSGGSIRNHYYTRDTYLSGNDATNSPCGRRRRQRCGRGSYYCRGSL